MLKNDEKGTYLPKLNEDMCNLCGICYKVCPGHSINSKQQNLQLFGKDPDALIGNYRNCYAGFSTDYEIRYNASSGGLVTQLLLFALRKGIIDGALVTRMKKDKPLEPEPFIARTREEIISASKSKYCPVPANIALKEILEKDGKYAVVGLPCQIHGIRKAEEVSRKLRKRITIHFGLVCNHTPTFHATEYLLDRLGIAKDKVVRIDYRGKGWPGGMTIRLRDNGCKYVQYFASEYWGLIFSKFFWPWRCSLCVDKINELSDISFMDAWLPKYLTDKAGRSFAVSRNEVGEELLHKASSEGEIEVNYVTENDIICSQAVDVVRKQYLARNMIMRLWGRNVPIYIHNSPSLRPQILDYFRAFLFYLFNIMSYKSALIDAYLALWRRIDRSNQRFEDAHDR